MKSNFERIGDHIRLVDERNRDESIKILLGLTIEKIFIPSVANTIGSDMANYKVIRRGQFACSLMQVRRDKRMPVALLDEIDEAIISQAYPVFQIKDSRRLDPEYLMMWFRRPEFDREACFHAVGGVRGSLEWEDFCNLRLPVPTPEKQREIVAEYNTVVKRIALNEKLGRKLEETAQAIYKHWFVDFEFPMSAEDAKKLGKPELEGKPYQSTGGEMMFDENAGVCLPRAWTSERISKLIDVRDGTHDSPSPTTEGNHLVTSKHLQPYNVDIRSAYLINAKDFDQINRRSLVENRDILMSMIGTVGTISYVTSNPVDYAIKNICLFKSSHRPEIAPFFLLSLKSAAVATYLDQCMSGSTQSYVSLSDLRKIPIVLPDSKTLKRFSAPIGIITDFSCRVAKEYLLLENLKDLLLRGLSDQ